MQNETINRIDLRTLHCFEKVAALGSFSEAGRQLGLSRAAVSRLVAKLEEQVGTKLLQRTTRSAALTDEGRALYEAAMPALATLKDALTEAALATEALSGPVTFSVSRAFCEQYVLPALPAFRRDHPQVQIEMSVGDRLDDLVTQRLDFSLRMGEPPESSLVVRKLADIPLVLAASAKVVSGMDVTTAEDLRALPQIGFRIPGTQRVYPWVLERGGVAETVAPEGAHIVSNAVEDIAALMRAGLGAAVVPRYLIDAELRAGALIELLPDHRLAAIPLHLCFPSRGKRPARVTALSDHLARHIRQALRR